MAAQQSEGREEELRGRGTRTISPTPAWTVSAQTLGFFATILGEPIPTSLQRGNPVLGLLALVPSAVLGTESCLGGCWPGGGAAGAEAQETGNGREGSESRCLVLQGKKAVWWQDPDILECQGQGMASPCGLWEALQKAEAMVRLIVLYQGQPGLPVVAGLDGG